MTLVLLNDDGEPTVLRRVPPGEARREHALRDLIAERPAVLPVHDLDPSYGQLVTVTRELNVPGVGFIDVLLIDEHGRLVVVECKLWRNPQARREVVGQILDYARELARYSYEDLQRQVSIATGRRGNVLFELAREAGRALDEAAFVDRVSRDLAAGRFLLLVAGDGITEGTRRIGEYLRDQPGFAFTFGLIEIAEYRHRLEGAERTILQPRVLAQTTSIERHIIRSETPGIVIEPLERASAAAATLPTAMSDAGRAWRAFVERFVAETRFDDPGQPPPRQGGLGWIRVPLPAGLYVNVYRSSASGTIGAQIKFAGAEGAALFESLAAEREEIDRELNSRGLASLTWNVGDPPDVIVRRASPVPWTAEVESEQRDWMAAYANQLVNSFRPRLQRLNQAIAA